MALPVAESRTSICHVWDAPTAGTVGVNENCNDSDDPRLPKYSTEISFGVPKAPATVDAAGRLTPTVIAFVGFPTN